MHFTFYRLLYGSFYPKSILNIEEKIVRENYREALNEIEKLVGSFDFVFLRDLKIVTQLAVRLKDTKRLYIVTA